MVSTERGGWEEFTGIGQYAEHYRFRMVGDRLDYQFWHDSLIGSGWINGETEEVELLLRMIWQERTATRDRERRQRELVEKWRQDEGDETAMVVGKRKCAADLEATLSDAPAPVEADRQGDIAKQLYETLRGVAGKCRPFLSLPENMSIDRAFTAYEALHGTEGVKHGA